MGTRLTTTPTYVCLFLAEFPAQALLRLRPDRRTQPVAVLSGDPPFEQVCSTNVAARRHGVHNGMTRAEMDGFPFVTLLRQSFPEERSTRAALLETLAPFTPAIEVVPWLQTGFALVLDLTGTSRLWGAPKTALALLATTLRHLHLRARICAASNFLAAVHLASSTHGPPRLLSPGQEPSALAPLPLAALQISPEQAQTFALWGLSTVGELASLPDADIVMRLGQEGRRLQLCSRGQHPHLFVPEAIPLTLEEQIAFDAPLDLLDSLLFVLGPMLDQLIERARARIVALASITLALRLEGGLEHRRTITTALPTTDRRSLLRLLQLDLQAHPPADLIHAVHLSATPGDLSKVQLGLFSPVSPEPMRMEITLKRIAALVGEHNVGRARLLEAHGHNRFAMEPFSVTNTTTIAGRTRPVAQGSLRRFRPSPPVPVRLEHDRLSAVCFQARWYSVRELYGPWHASGDWWSASVWSREEWDLRAESAEGHTLLCVVGFDTLQQQWHMEALYD